MNEHTITERQQYWLDHILAAEAFNGTLVEYARIEGLKVKDASCSIDEPLNVSNVVFPAAIAKVNSH